MYFRAKLYNTGVWVFLVWHARSFGRMVGRARLAYIKYGESTAAKLRDTQTVSYNTFCLNGPFCDGNNVLAHNEI